jgi:hypothetical protein
LPFHAFPFPSFKILIFYHIWEGVFAFIFIENTGFFTSMNQLPMEREAGRFISTVSGVRHHGLPGNFPERW